MTAPAKSSTLSWGFSTLGCAELSLPQVCKLLDKFGLRELEIRALDGRMDLPRWAVDTGWPPLRAAALMAEHQLHFCVAGSSFKLVGNNEKSRDEMVAFSKWADSWGATFIRAFGGGTWGTPLTDTDYTQAAHAVGWWYREKQRHGWRTDLLLETHDAFSASDPCHKLMARLTEPIGIIWDSHHTWRLGGESPRESWKQLGKWVRHVHVKDSISRPSARHPFTYVLPGDGETPLGDIVQVLGEHRFAGAVSLEWERLWHSYLPPLQEALIRLQAQPWFAPSVQAVDEIQSPAIAR
ncbi:MAG TPA: TIM barrel protein [Verrucomicrobiae bacterium]|nr:TIM barrel protein [Verrucomicrobiae bacterium]